MTKEYHEERKRGMDNGKEKHGAKDYDCYDKYREKELERDRDQEEKGCKRRREYKVEVRDLEKEDTMKDRERGKDRDPNKEPTVGKGLSGALQLLQQRGTLKGRNMDKKKSNLAGVADHSNGSGKEKEIFIDRRVDRFDRILTPKESFRMLSYAFHGKGSGKRN